jgi:site-specific DNA recombinase
MQASRSNGFTYYRCRYPRDYAAANGITHPNNVNLAEEAVITPLDAWLATAFNPTNREHTITAMHDSQPTDAADPRLDRLLETVRECDRKLDRYRTALDAGADPAVVTKWITACQAERRHAERQLRAAEAATPIRLTRETIRSLVDHIGDIVDALIHAEPDTKARLYRKLGLRLDYTAETRTVHARIESDVHRNQLVCVRGGT